MNIINNKTLGLLQYLQKSRGVSRRNYEQMIKSKSVFINEILINSINQTVNIGDKLKIILPEGEIFEEIIKITMKFRPIIVAFNKPIGYTVSKEDKYNKTIYQILPSSWKKDFYYIGRLDKDSHGLLLLTNDPKLVDYYENPKNKIIKIYEVEINKPFKSKDLFKTKKGLFIDQDGNIIRSEVLDKPDGTEELKFYDINYINLNGKHILRILLNEGKKHHIRRLISSVGYKITDLKRIKVGKYELGNIKSGNYKIFKI